MRRLAPRAGDCGRSFRLPERSPYRPAMTNTTAAHQGDVPELRIAFDGNGRSVGSYHITGHLNGLIDAVRNALVLK